MSELLEPLDPELRLLVDAEMRAKGPSSADAERVFAGLAAIVPAISGAPLLSDAPAGAGATAATTKAAAAASGWVAKGAVIALVSFASGGATGIAVDRSISNRGAPARAPTAMPTAITSGSSAPSAAPPLETATRETPPAEAHPARPSQSHASVPPVAPSSSAPGIEARPDATLAQERYLVQGARVAVLRGDGSVALSLLDEHRARFPRGRLAEERDALRVQALGRAGRLDEARSEASAFRQRYPDSLFLPAIDGVFRVPRAGDANP